MKQKILAIDQGEHLGGAERFCAELLTRLAKDHDITLLASSNPQYHELYKGSKVRIEAMDIPRLKPISLRTLASFRSSQKAISKKIEELKPDIILSNTVRTHLLSSQPTKKADLPLVWMAHDLTFPKILLKRFIKYPDSIVSCSQHVQQYYQDVSPPNSADHHVLYPFGLENSQHDPSPIEDREPIVGMVGKFIPWKGQELFIKAAVQLSQTFPDYRFDLIGSPYVERPESVAYFQHCQDLIRENGLEHMFQIRESKNAQKQMKNWRILVHCSSAPEPLGRVVLEGMAAGCAVVASELGGPQEIVQDGTTGLLVNPTEEDLLAALQKLLSDPALQQGLGDKAHEWVQGHFSWQRQLETFEKIIEKLAERS